MELAYRKAGDAKAVLIVDGEPVAANASVTFRADVLAETMYQLTRSVQADKAADPRNPGSVGNGDTAPTTLAEPPYRRRRAGFATKVAEPAEQ